VSERADAVEFTGSRTPDFGSVAGSPRETAVVVGDKAAEHGVGRVPIGGLGKAEFTAQAILQDTPEAFDAAFGLGRLRGDEGDAELREGSAELGGLALTSKFFFERPAGSLRTKMLLRSP